MVAYVQACTGPNVNQATLSLTEEYEGFEASPCTLMFAVAARQNSSRIEVGTDLETDRLRSYWESDYWLRPSVL